MVGLATRRPYSGPLTPGAGRRSRMYRTMRRGQPAARAAPVDGVLGRRRSRAALGAHGGQSATHVVPGTLFAEVNLCCINVLVDKTL